MWKGVARHLCDDQETFADLSRLVLQGVRHAVRCFQGNDQQKK